MVHRSDNGPKYQTNFTISYSSLLLYSQQSATSRESRKLATKYYFHNHDFTRIPGDANALSDWFLPLLFILCDVGHFIPGGGGGDTSW